MSAAEGITFWSKGEVMRESYKGLDAYLVITFVGCPRCKAPQNRVCRSLTTGFSTMPFLHKARLDGYMRMVASEGQTHEIGKR